MDLTTVLTGMLPAIIVLSALLSALLSFILLRSYRRAVIRAMNKGRQTDDLAHPTSPQAGGTCGTLSFSTPTTDTPLTPDAAAAHARISGSVQRSGFIYLLAGLAYTVTLSLPWMISADDGFPLMRFLWLVSCYAWPTVITLQLVATTSGGQRLAVYGIYALLLLFIAATAMIRNPELGIGSMIYFWVSVNGAATLLLAAFMTRRIQAVGPLVLVFVVAGVTGASVVFALMADSEEVLRGISILGSDMGLSATSLFLLMLLAGFIPFAAVGWWLLGRLGASYRLRRMSDQSITADAIWLLFGVLQSITLVFEDWRWIFTGLIGFTLYKLISRIGFTRASRQYEKAGCSLLLLRVFSLGRRSEQLFSRFAKRWRRIGDINLIAGPSLVTSTVEPHEFLDFVGGRLSRRFIETEQDLRGRLDDRAISPDPDGLFRVNEFFCRRHSWQMTMQQLALSTKAVLMDLRSFSRENQGCMWELEQLLRGISLERVILLLDETTDLQLLENRLQEIWRQLPPNSINCLQGNAKLRLLPLTDCNDREIGQVVQHTLAAYHSSPPV